MKSVFVFLRHFYLPPQSDGISEADSEWVEIPCEYQEQEDGLTSIAFPHMYIRYAADAIITNDGRIVKFFGLPQSYKGKYVDQPVLDRLREISWDSTKTRCKDCPEFPWKTVMDTELIKLRVDDTYGSQDKMNRFFSSNEADKHFAELHEIFRMIKNKPVSRI